MQEKNALNNFKIVLGKYCAVNQFIELSKRSFIDEHQRDIQQRDMFIELATKYEVTLTNYDADKMGNEISKSYIVNVHLCFETFLKNVCNKIRKYGKNEYIPRRQEESYLACAVSNICGDSLPHDIISLYELCEYYRLIRNKAVHDLGDVDSHEKQYRKLQKFLFKTDAKFAQLAAPNKYEKIVNDIPNKQVNMWKKYNQERREKALYSYIKTKYNVDEDLNEQISYMFNMIMTR